MGILGHYTTYNGQYYNAGRLFTPELYFLLVATTCLITSTLLLLACFISIATATILPKTVFVSSYFDLSAHRSRKLSNAEVTPYAPRTAPLKHFSESNVRKAQCATPGCMLDKYFGNMYKINLCEVSTSLISF